MFRLIPTISHTIHKNGKIACMNGILMVNVAKYTSPMDPMGFEQIYVFKPGFVGFQPAKIRMVRWTSWLIGWQPRVSGNIRGCRNQTLSGVVPPSYTGTWNPKWLLFWFPGWGPLFWRVDLQTYSSHLGSRYMVVSFFLVYFHPYPLRWSNLTIFLDGLKPPSTHRSKWSIMKGLYETNQ